VRYAELDQLGHEAIRKHARYFDTQIHSPLIGGEEGPEQSEGENGEGQSEAHFGLVDTLTVKRQLQLG
jgi:hypothetical protein